MISIAYVGLAAAVALGSLKVADTYHKEHYAQHIFLPKSSIAPINPENNIFIFDMHKVFMEQDFLSIYADIIKNYYRPMSGLLLYPSTYRNAGIIAQETKVAECITQRLEDLYPQLKGIQSHMQNLFLQQAFMHDTIALIKQLKSNGYKIYVLSNCAEETYKLLEKRYPEIFTLFDGYYLPSVENKYDFKPRNSFYKGCKTYLAQQGNESKMPIFIDDRKKNVLSALSEDFMGIHFVTAAQLKKDLHTLKALDSTEALFCEN